MAAAKKLAAGSITLPKVDYFVAVDVPQPSGGTVYGHRLSRSIRSARICRRVYKRIQRTVPGAFMVQVIQYR